MKKITLVVLVIVSILLVACQSKSLSDENVGSTKEVFEEDKISEEEAARNVQKENEEYISENVSTEKNSDITITYEDKSREEKDANGNLLLTITGNMPIITIKNNEAATQKIKEYYDEKQKKLEEKVNEYIKYATDNYTLLNTDQVQYWMGYELGETYESARVDNAVISMVEESYEYAGGAHPNTTRSAQNFDTQTGQHLTLNDVLTDVSKGTEFINNYLLEKMKESKDDVGFFEDYESSVKDILTDETWYLNDEGFVVISNPYIVSPYAAGIQEYVIPYSEFPYLAEKYQKK